MFTLALLIGIYSYFLFALGLAGLFYRNYIVGTTIFYIFTIFYFYKKTFTDKLFQCFSEFKKRFEFRHFTFESIRQNITLIMLSLMLMLQVLVNLVGVLGPELAFDALWYHLALPKIYLQNHSISYIPGGLLYYSAMPKLTEMLYAAGLAFGSETIPKFIHFSFGILSLIALYKLSRKFLSRVFSLLAVVLFYSNLVVGWMSITAYIDLARTFFEIMALWGFIEWFEKKKKKWFILSAVMLGFAISTKLLALGSFLIFSILIVYIAFSKKEEIKTVFNRLLSYWIIALFIVFSWLVFAFINTGNPIHPFFTNIYPAKFNFGLINPLNLPDPISPLYVISLPLAVFLYGKLKLPLKVISLYSFIAIVVWQITPHTGGGRFILPYLPAFSIVSVAIIEKIGQVKLRFLFVGAIIAFALFSIFYRGVANSKYIPVILGKESKSQFLSSHLNFSFGDFYDTDNYFEDNIKTDDKVLLYGFHNLYYVDFPFIDSSYVKKGNAFNYIAVQEGELPERFRFWDLIYYNDKTNVRLYSIGGLRWVY